MMKMKINKHFLKLLLFWNCFILSVIQTYSLSIPFEYLMFNHKLSNSWQILFFCLFLSFIISSPVVYICFLVSRISNMIIGKATLPMILYIVHSIISLLLAKFL